jgi:integrase
MPLAATTIKNYASVINALTNLGHILPGPPPVLLPSLLDAIKSVENPQTRKSKLSAVLDLIRDRSEAEKKPYKDVFAIAKKACDELAKSQTLPPVRLAKMLSWSEVLALKSKAKDLDPEDYLIYCLYTLNAPVRADYVDMLVVDKYTAKHKADVSRNYCVINKDKGYFVFNQHKTMQTYGQVIVPIHKELLEIIKETCNTDDDLLSQKTPGDLSQIVIRIFNKLSGKQMGIGLLRHSFISEYLLKTRRIVDKDAIAKTMMHTYVTQETYAVIDDSD